MTDELIAEPAEMRNCDLCGAKNIGGSHGCLAFDVVMKAHRELQAKYEKALAFIKRASTGRDLWFNQNIDRKAQELLKELE